MEKDDMSRILADGLQVFGKLPFLPAYALRMCGVFTNSTYLEVKPRNETRLFEKMIDKINQAFSREEARVSSRFMQPFSLNKIAYQAGEGNARRQPNRDVGWASKVRFRSISKSSQQILRICAGRGQTGVCSS
jgi:hypothetical protein